MRLALCFVLLTSMSLQAATIAVIDSGVDVEHKDLINNIWTNSIDLPDTLRDEDNNGYQDDVYGWNFAEGNNLVIDRKYIGTFSEDPYKFFDIQGRSFLGEATEEDKKWVEEKRKDPNFMKEMQIFGNFVHGTHVAGITVKENDSKIVSVKLIPTEVNPLGSVMQKKAMLNPQAPADFRWKILEAGFSKLAEQQMLLLEEIAAYVNGHKADVANGSFGTGFAQAKMITDTLFKAVFFRAPKEDESDKAARLFMNALITHGDKMVKAAPNTLFVFAAGNDGSDNDLYPTSPTNIVADNVISVAATYQNQYLAPFSNYGATKVDVAAPGMLIYSAIPGNEHLKVSGTSQAAPYVANVAAVVKDSNKALTPKDIKKILMGTVDKKGFLAGKVVSGGSVNIDRARVAAELTLTNSVDDAISISFTKIPMKKSFERLVTPKAAFDIIPMKMPSLFR